MLLSEIDVNIVLMKLKIIRDKKYDFFKTTHVLTEMLMKFTVKLTLKTNAVT